MTTTFLLLLLTVLLVWPAPHVLSRLTSLRRVPRAAMGLWQAVALAAVLAAFGTGLSLATGPMGMPRRVVLGAEPGPDVVHVLVAACAVLVTVTVLGRLLVSGHRVGTRLRSLRRRHRELVDLLGESGPVPGLRLLEHATPTAYCVPSLHRNRVVVSAGARGLLSDVELDAVLAHERAHLRARHDLVLEAFTVLTEAFPRVTTGRSALREARLLIELLADRVAVRRTGPVPLGRALCALAGSGPPGATLGAGPRDPGDLVVRLRVLGDPAPHRLLATCVWASAVAILLAPTVFVVLPWISGQVGGG